MNVGGLKKLKTIERNPLYKTQDLKGGFKCIIILSLPVILRGWILF
jgi:hypothetical protein